VCVNTGTIPSKSFKEAVVFLSGIRQRSIYGPAFRVKPDITMGDLTFRCNRVMQAEIETIKAQLQRNHIDMLYGHAQFIGPHTIEISNQAGSVRKTAEKFVIAVGAKPYRPEHIKFNGTTILDSDDVLNLAELPREMTVVGGGVIGTEYASMFAALGVSVTVVDQRKRLLGFVDEVLERGLFDQVQLSSYVELSLEFGIRAQGNRQESLEIGLAVSLVSLGDIRWNGKRAAFYLVLERILFTPFKNLVGRGALAARPLPNIEFLKGVVSHGNS
jgi:pyruvate/2-oxoglutarate dehydrogenase complex dihydrolipoamide dehydrogenase (E3) component